LKSDHHIRVPFPTPAPLKDALYKFKFQTPASIKLVGAYGLKAAAKTPDGITVDVAVQMPDVCTVSLVSDS
jgi:U3 small nucleolar RNA-associated protein 22